MEGISLRAACEADLPVINDIYNYYVLHSTCTFQLEPGSDDDRRRWFAGRGERYPVIVAELGEKVIGWGALSKFRERAAYDHTVEASVYIHHDQLGHGIGRLLLVDLVERAKSLGFHTLLGGACTEQAASIKLQETLGFQQVGHLREVGFKFGRWLDVVYMQRML